MVKCPSCKVDSGTTLMTERLDIDELSEDRVIVYCPNPNCNVF